MENVLILVLVDHTLGALQQSWIVETRCVLILVLVDHTLGVYMDKSKYYS